MTDDLHALSGAYALDALPQDELLEFEQHLRGCPACRREVADFRAVCAQLATVVAEPVPASLRTQVLTAVEGMAAETIQWAIGELLGARTRQDVVDVVVEVIDRLGGWVVPADLADDRALPLDVGLGSGAPLLPAAEPDSRARQELESHLPQLVEDARQSMERISRSAAQDRAGSGESDSRGR